jgi:hypothetical protein
LVTDLTIFILLKRKQKYREVKHLSPGHTEINCEDCNTLASVACFLTSALSVDGLVLEEG